MGVRGHYSGLAVVFDVWSNCLFFHSVFSHESDIEATVSCEVTAFWKIQGTWKIAVLHAKQIPFWLKETALPPVIATNAGLMKNRLIFLILVLHSGIKGNCEIPAQERYIPTLQVWAAAMEFLWRY